MKRLFDLLVSSSLIIPLLPFMLLIGIIIKLTSPGPMFHFSIRLGRNAKPFHYFKFRSMLVNTEKVTSFGAFIRRWHLDELPELFLVFIGRMSLVGPRPCCRNYIKRNCKLYYESLRAKPGITGPCQIKRNRRHTLEDIIYLNNWYHKNQGFVTDAKIIFCTPLAILKQKIGVTETLTIF